MPHRHAQIIVACSDHRMNPRIKQEIAQNDALDVRTIPIRTAGGDVRSATDTIRDVLDNNKVASILVLTHTDCKYRAARFDSLRSLGAELNPSIVHPKTMKFAEIGAFEHYDNAAILAATQHLVSGRKENYEIRLEQVDVSGIKVPDNAHIKKVLEVGRPDALLYGRESDELMGKYMLSSTRGLDETTGGIVRFFVERGIVEKVSFVTVEEQHRRDAAADANRLKIAPWMIPKKVEVATESLLRV